MKIDSWKVRELIAEQQRSMTDVAQRAGLTQKNLADVLNKGTCRLATGGRIAAALGVSVREIWIMEE